MPPKKTTATAPKKTAVVGKSTGATKKSAGAPKVKKATTTNTPSTTPAAAAPAPAPEAGPVGITIGLKAINTVLFDGKVDNEFRKSGRCALLVDPSERATVFLRYRDVNALNVLNPSDMQSERIRLAVLGALRFGKPVLLETMTGDLAQLWGVAVQQFDTVKPGLMDSILDGSVKTEESIRSLIREGDQPEYAWGHYDESFLDNFSFILATSALEVPPAVVNRFFTITVE